MKPVGRPIISAIRSRGYAAQAAAARRAEPPTANQPQVTRLPSGITVATLETGNPIARLAFVHHAGSRYENGDNRGVAHAVRSCINLGTQNKFLMGINRGMQHIGASLTCSTTREHMIYSTEVVRTEFDTAYDILSDVAQYPAFKPHEMGGFQQKILLDSALLSQQPTVQLMEGLHEMAYRTTLGYSLYMPESCIHLHSPDSLREFTESNYGGSNTLVIGLGVDHDDLVEKVKGNGKTGKPQSREPAKYYGGEVRLNNVQPTSDLVHAAVVSESVNLKSSELLAVGVLQQLLGTGPVVPYGSSRVAKTQLPAGSGAVSSLNASYTDSGLFGFQVAAPSKEIGAVLESTMKAYNDAKAGLTEEDVQRGKNQLRVAVGSDLTQGETLVEDLALQLTVGDTVTLPADVDAAISKVTLADVQKVAKKVINNGKPTMAAVGNLAHTPNVDQLV